MNIVEMTTLGSETRQFMDADTGQMLTPEQTVEYLKEVEKKNYKYTRLDDLAHEWNAKCKSKVPYEFIEWLKMVM